MDPERFNAIWNLVVVDKYYAVGCIDPNEPSDITHEEMCELLKMAQDAMLGTSGKHLRVWWKQADGHRYNGVVIEGRYSKKGPVIFVRVDHTNEFKFINGKDVDASEWIDDPNKG